MDNKANLMDPNKQHHLTLDIDQIDGYIKKKASAAGEMLYRYPGQLVDSDDEYNAGDIEENLNFGKESNDSDSIGSDTESWQKGESDGSDYSFNSSKMFDGYKDFLQHQKKQEIKAAKEAAEAEDGYVPKKKDNKQRRGRKTRGRDVEV